MEIISDGPLDHTLEWRSVLLTPLWVVDYFLMRMGIDRSQGFVKPPADVGGIARYATSVLASLFRVETTSIFYTQLMIQTGQSVQKLYRF